MTSKRFWLKSLLPHFGRLLDFRPVDGPYRYAQRPLNLQNVSFTCSAGHDCRAAMTTLAESIVSAARAQLRGCGMAKVCRR